MNNLNFDGLTDAQLRLFAVRCARRVQHLMSDPRSIAALDVAERHAKGEATYEELEAARATAWSAADVAMDAAVAARTAAVAARAAASNAAMAAAYGERVAARAAEIAAQQATLFEIRHEQPR